MAIPIRLLKRRERRAPVTALGKDLRAAQAAAYAAVETIHFEGAHFRRDIAAKALL
jgi:phosphoribosylamine--glycine ligase